MVEVKGNKKNRDKGNMGTSFQFLNPRHFILYFDLLIQTMIKSTIVGADLQLKQLVSLRARDCLVITRIHVTFKGKQFHFQ